MASAAKEGKVLIIGRAPNDASAGFRKAQTPEPRWARGSEYARGGAEAQMHYS